MLEVPAGGGAPITVGSGLSDPTGVAVDAAGDVFVADKCDSRIVEVPAGGGAPITVTNTIYNPSGVAVDAAGNLFFVTAGDNQLQEIPQLSNPVLNFAAAPVGATSSDSPQSVTLQNIGNASLAATALAVSSSFEQVAGPGAPADCTATFLLAPGGSSWI